jgi:hypothetical protein
LNAGVTTELRNRAAPEARWAAAELHAGIAAAELHARAATAEAGSAATEGSTAAAPAAAERSATSATAETAATATTEASTTTSAAATVEAGTSATAAVSALRARRYTECSHSQNSGRGCRNQRSFHGMSPRHLCADPSCNEFIPKMFASESLTLCHHAKL